MVTGAVGNAGNEVGDEISILSGGLVLKDEKVMPLFSLDCDDFSFWTWVLLGGA